MPTSRATGSSERQERGDEYALRHTCRYRRLVFVGGSAFIVLIAGLWMVERVLDLQLGLI